MRCEQWSERLLLLAYDELPAAEAAEVERHVAGCAVCRQRLDELRDTQRLLDLAPARVAQVDLAKVCLRLAARERLAVSQRRWAWGAMAIAASVAVLAAVRFLDVNLEPGRVTIAWQPVAAARQVPEGNPAGQGGIEAAIVRGADGDTEMPIRPVDADAWLDSDDTSLATVYARRWGERPVASAARSSQGDTSVNDFRAQPPTRTYGDWRRELLPTGDSLPQLSTLPGA